MAASLHLTVTPSQMPTNGPVVSACPSSAVFLWGPYTLMLSETNGVGLTVTAIDFATLNAAGEVVYTESASATGVGNGFLHVPGPIRVQANGTVTSVPQYDCEAPSFATTGGGRRTTVTGTDDSGGVVTATVTLGLSAS